MNREDARQVLLPDISVIVPVYNMKNYLRQCLDSLIVQTMENIEIIVVDDGSTDSSPQICDEYAEKDPRIIVIHRENGGLSAARNSGLDEILVDWGFRSREFLEEHGAKRIVSSTEEIYKIITEGER